MKQFKPFDKIIYRTTNENPWIPSFYQCIIGDFHFVLDREHGLSDENIFPYEGNEHLIGTINEPEEEIILKKGDLILAHDDLTAIREGLGCIRKFKKINNNLIMLTSDACYTYCLPMSKYNSENLEETAKWVLMVKNGKLVKVNK